MSENRDFKVDDRITIKNPAFDKGDDGVYELKEYYAFASFMGGEIVLLTPNKMGEEPRALLYFSGYRKEWILLIRVQDNSKEIFIRGKEGESGHVPLEIIGRDSPPLKNPQLIRPDPGIPTKTEHACIIRIPLL